MAGIQHNKYVRRIKDKLTRTKASPRIGVRALTPYPENSFLSKIKGKGKDKEDEEDMVVATIK